MSRRAAAGWAALGAGASAAVILALTAVSQSADSPTTKPDSQATVLPTSSERDGDVRIDLAEQKRIGLTVAPVLIVSAPTITRGFARGLDAATLAAIEADIVSARAAADASQAEAGRLALLASQDQSASVKSVQAARAQAAGDAARAELAIRRVGLEYGPGLARMGPTARRALIADIATGRAALVRIDIPGADIAGVSHVMLDGGGGSIRVIGPAASADARLQSVGMLGILTGPAANSAVNGRIFGITIERGGADKGIVVPRDAVLRWRGGLWVYRQDGPETFKRVELVNARPIAQGWFVPSGLADGSDVVTGAAGTLLAIDRGGGAAAEGD